MAYPIYNAYFPGGLFATGSIPGWRPDPLVPGSNQLLMHKGVDFKGLTPGVLLGQPIPAAVSGKVYRVANDPTGWGNYVVIKSEPVGAPPFYTLYAHLQQPSTLEKDASVKDPGSGLAFCLFLSPHNKLVCSHVKTAEA